jgi:hypothetical protein
MKKPEKLPDQPLRVRGEGKALMHLICSAVFIVTCAWAFLWLYVIGSFARFD